MVLIGSTRLRSLERHLHYVEADAPIVIGLSNLDAHPEQLAAAGFPAVLESGQRLLPAKVGPVSEFNAEGGWERHRDQPKETAYREFNWEWKQWDGTWHSDTVYQAYERYPRTKIEPPAVELEVQEAPGGARVLVTDALTYAAANQAALLHRVNLLRELFGEAQVFTEALEQYTKVELKRLNWQVLPPGEMPWAQLQAHVRPLIDRMGVRKGPVVERRLKVLTEDHEPQFAAVGQAGFSGYLVFGFGELYVLESLYYGNATYVFGQDWEELSQMTKAQVICGNLQQERIIHRQNWEGQICQLLD